MSMREKRRVMWHTFRMGKVRKISKCSIDHTNNELKKIRIDEESKEENYFYVKSNDNAPRLLTTYEI